MKIASAGARCLLLYDDGQIHYPASKYLSERFTNPHTREQVGQALRLLIVFLHAYGIELATRAADGECLMDHECSVLIQLAYRPLPELEALTSQGIRDLTRAKAKVPTDELGSAVDPNTAKKRLNNIAGFLDYYRVAILEYHIRSSSTRGDLNERYRYSIDRIANAIRGTKQSHHHDIKSLPSEVFKKITRAIFLDFEALFATDGGKRSTTMYRDRAMALLAQEGLRPGSIANVARNDFQSGGYLRVVDNRQKREQRVTTGTPVLKLGKSTSVNSATETTLRLQPVTAAAVEEYLAEERSKILGNRLKNHSSGFMFLNIQGRPIKHRATITALFAKLSKRLTEQGLLDVQNDPYFRDKETYDFYAYVLRHSACSLFLAEKGTAETVLDQMKTRFGWTLRSKMPEKYAARALSDEANLDLMDYNKSLLAELAKKRADSLVKE